MNLSNRVIGCAIEVHSVLGSGFIESVYDNALAYELTMRQIGFERQVPIDVWFRDQIVGRFAADYLIEGKLILELKALKGLHPAAIAQVLNYLKASKLQVGLLLNFGNTKLEIKRVVNGLQIEHSI